ncbi:MAG: acyltransferase, partial [Bacteroidetes bacterium]|nr:acyltransferase [Bacteroidota bacterium]
MKNNLPLLQAIRCLAAILVVLHHVSASSATYFNTAWLYDFFNSSRGIDLFFVLSGFIITYTHISDLERKTNTTAFLTRRFIRIYPFFWVISLCYLVFFIATKAYTMHSVASAFMIKSFLLIDTGIPPLVRVAWTLSYELIFYVAFAICMALGMRFAKTVWLVWVPVIIICCLLLPADSIPDPFKVYMLEILTGCFAGYLLSRMPLSSMSARGIGLRYKSLFWGGVLIFAVLWALEFLTGFS